MKLMGQVTRTFTRIVDAPLRDLGLAIGQLPVLVTLKRLGTTSQTELTRIAMVEQSSMAQLLQRMERDGLITRAPDPADGRSRLITLTAHASRQMPQGKAVLDATSEQALAGFSPDERAQLVAFLQRMEANLSTAAPQ